MSDNLVVSRQNLVAAQKEVAALSCKGHRVAIEQAKPELLFERCDMAGEGGLRDMELIGCGIEVQRFGKDTELSYILKHFIPPDIQGPPQGLVVLL